MRSKKIKGSRKLRSVRRKNRRRGTRRKLKRGGSKLAMLQYSVFGKKSPPLLGLPNPINLRMAQTRRRLKSFNVPKPAPKKR